MSWVGKFGKEYENLSFSINLSEINCAEKKLRKLSSTEYDHKGSLIDSSSLPSNWIFIVPESIAESLYEKVCK